MAGAKRIVEELLDDAGIKINGPNPWDIAVKDERFYARVLVNKSLGLGESYMDGWWDPGRLDEFIYRILLYRIDKKIRGGIRLLFPLLEGLLLNLQTRRRATKVIKKHYDLDNDLFLSFLDPYNQYSCAYYNGDCDLNHAQIRKMELICKKLGVRPGDHVLDIGFGWGGLAQYMAERYGCSVTGISISREQINYANAHYKNLPLTFLYSDYRDISGPFDQIVSVGMFEHVGYKNYRDFMLSARSCLKDGGVFLLHTIGGNESEARADPWVIKHIFPNSSLPSIAQITRAAEGLFVMEDLHNLGPHYDKTLLAWNANFQDAWPRLKQRFDQRFKRMWEYYLLSSAGAFRARYVSIWQIVLSTYGSPQPHCRHS